MRIILFFIFTIVFTASTVAQNLPDSIQYQIDTATTAKSKVVLLNSFARNQLFVDVANAHAVIDSSFRFAKQNSDPNLLALAFQEKAVLNLIMYKYKEAQPFIKKAIYYSKQTSNNLRTGYNYRNLGVSFFHLSEYDSSLNYFFKGLAYFDTTDKKHKEYFALTTLELAKVFFETDNLNSCLKYAKISRDIFGKSANPRYYADAFNLIALVFSHQDEENYDSAKYYLLKANSIKDSLGLNSPEGKLVHYANLSMIYIKNNEFNEAMKYARKAAFTKPFINRKNKANVWVNFGKALLETGKIDSAIWVNDSAIILAQTTQNNYALERAYNNAGLLATYKNDFKEAYNYVLKSKEVAVENYKIKTAKIIEAKELELALNEKNQKLDYLQKEKNLLQTTAELQENINKITIVGIGLLLVIVFFLLYLLRKVQMQRKKLQKSYQEIKEQKEVVDTLNKNNNTLFSIIGHDLRGPIVNISSVFEMFPTENDKLSGESLEIIDAVKETLQNTLHVLINLLAWSKTEDEKLKITPKPINILEKINEILAIFKIILKNKNINITIDGSAQTIGLIDEASFDVIVRNLLSNSIRFSAEGATLEVNWIENEHSILLSFEDFAGGLPQSMADFINTKGKKGKLAHHGDAAKGLGFRLIKSFVYLSKLGLSYTPTQKGSRFTLTIPKHLTKR